LVSIYVVFYSSEIIYIWLGSGYDDVSVIVSIMVIPMVLSIGMEPFSSLLLTSGNVRFTGLVTILIGVLSVLFNFLYLNGYFSIDVDDVLVVTSITSFSLFFKNAVILPAFSIFKLGVLLSDVLRLYKIVIIVAISSFLFIYFLDVVVSGVDIFKINGHVVVTLFYFVFSIVVLYWLKRLYFVDLINFSRGKSDI
uniref:hypothetical protein n=1 Tax=Thaumasiovibrio occultus TaxID=1891184 RepID=UPI00131E7EE5